MKENAPLLNFSFELSNCTTKSDPLKKTKYIIYVAQLNILTVLKCVYIDKKSVYIYY